MVDNEIPKIIHQIWYQGEAQIPNKYIKNIQTWKQFHPHWEYHLWDETKMLQVISKYSPEIRQMFQSFPYMHQKIDFFKYVILYQIGGIYVDIDAKAIKVIDPLLKKGTLLLSKVGTNYFESMMLTRHPIMVNNGIIFSRAQHPFLALLIKEIPKVYNATNPNMVKAVYISRTTGPDLMTNMYHHYQKNLMLTNKKISDQENQVVLLPHEYLEPCNPFDQVCQYTENTFADHQYELTWIPKWMHYLLKIYFWFKRWWFLILIIFIISRLSKN